MKFARFALSAAACTATFVISQAAIPTVKAQTVNAPAYRVKVERQQALAGPSGLVITGRVTNTGSKPLIYTQVIPVLEDEAGKAVYQGTGYLTVSPLLPGQSAEFRACERDAPAFRQLHIAFREAGNPVTTIDPPVWPSREH